LDFSYLFFFLIKKKRIREKGYKGGSFPLLV